MEKSAVALARYFSDIQERANLQDFNFNSSVPFSSVSFSEVESGKLSAETTAELVDLARGSSKATLKSRRSDAKADSKPIDLVISLVTLQDRTKKGLLLLPATLQPDGTLVADLESSPPWIPASRLHSPTVANSDVMVGGLSKFWRYRLKTWPEAVSKVETWADAVKATKEMFTAVADTDFDTAVADVGAEIIRDECFISTDKVIIANGAILDLYRYLFENSSAAGTFETLTSLGTAQRFPSESLDDDLDTLQVTALATCGSMSDEHPLTSSQRRAVHAFALDGKDSMPVTAVSGPPGTGKTTMLQSVVASTIVRHALEGRPAPLIVGTSTNNQAVTNIIDSFNSVTKDVPGPLDHRWLPRADGDLATGDPLSGIASYCPSQKLADKARESGYLTENGRKGGVYTEYSDPDYVKQASAFFLARMADYARSTGGVVRTAASLDEAIDVLRSALVRVDDQRKILINEKVQAERALGDRRSTELRQQIRRIEQERETFRSRLGFWTERQSEAAARPNRKPEDDWFVIEQNHDPAEPAPRQSTLAEYVSFYQQQVDERSRAISTAHTVFETEVKREAAAMAPTDQVRRATGWIAQYSELDDTRLAEIANATSLLELDVLLDTTVRYTEFWLAVHLYEAQWLKSVSGDDLIVKNERGRTTARVMDRYWSQVTSLTPCFVMTAFQLPKYFKLYKKDAALDFDLGRVDLLIVDEAGQVDTSVGAAAFAVAKRALVVGDVQQLAPVWSIDPESDEEIAEVHDLESRWPMMKTNGLTSSNGSSIMAAASAASRWSYGPPDDRLPGLLLTEHFRCHPGIIGYCNELLYQGMLVPSRPLDGYKLADRTPSPFLFREVEGSQDRRSGSSRVNESEAIAVAEWIDKNYDFFDAIYNSDGTSADSVVGVVTPFAAQAGLITRKIGEICGAQLRKKITVGTAHRLQGAERPVVLFSSTYGDNSSSASFVDSTLELMNVAVSRAKDLFIVFGGSTRWKDDGPVFSLVREYATRDDCEFADPSDDDGKALEVPQVLEPQRQNAEAAPAVPASPAPVSEVPAPVGSPAYKLVERTTSGYLIGGQLAAQWTAAGLVLNGEKPTAGSLNTALEQAGLITRTDGKTIPTPAGAALGIAAYEGGSGDGRYINIIYSPEAQEKLTAMVRSGELDT